MEQKAELDSNRHTDTPVDNKLQEKQNLQMSVLRSTNVIYYRIQTRSVNPLMKVT